MKIYKDIIKDLQVEIDQDYKIGCINFFKEKITLHGVRTPIVRKIARKYFKEKIRFFNKEELFNLCEILLKSDYNEEATIAIQFLKLRLSDLRRNDFKKLEGYLKKYINNWSKDDDFCTHVLGHMIGRYPELRSELFKWSRSSNMWVRRASAVSLISIIKSSLSEAFEISKILMSDKEDLVQKGYGWTLKVASNYYQKEVFNFVMENKEKMTRTALRYAIEKMPKNLKIKAMKI
ncbi:MAG: DNA alkylation repair protein [Patescibacteria group bacterium]